MSKQLKTCSSCHCSMLEEFFSINKKGVLYKTCDKCRNRQTQRKPKNRFLNPFKYRMCDMVSNAKKKDIKYNRYDANNHIDKPFIEQLFYEQDYRCIYCEGEMMLQCDAYSPELLTVERMDNKLGHIKSNCVLACLACNNERGHQYSFEKFKETMINRKEIIGKRFPDHIIFGF